jgi:hypothetical protein
VISIIIIIAACIYVCRKYRKDNNLNNEDQPIIRYDPHWFRRESTSGLRTSVMKRRTGHRHGFQREEIVDFDDPVGSDKKCDDPSHSEVELERGKPGWMPPPKYARNHGKDLRRPRTQASLKTARKMTVDQDDKVDLSIPGLNNGAHLEPESENNISKVFE